MVSRAQIAANRRNAQKSTGPKSAVGKARVAQNALKHGLAVAVRNVPEQVVDLAALAAQLSGTEKEPNPTGRARMAAAAELELLRVRRARAEASAGDDPIVALERIGRYEQRAWARRRTALNALYEGCD